MVFSHRNSRRSLLIEVNPFQILAAGVDRVSGTSITVDCAAEFESTDESGFRQWLAAHFEKPNTWVPAIASFIPPEALLQRESLAPRKLAEPNYLPDLVREQYKIDHPENWKIQTLSPLEGELIAPEGTQRPALVAGVSHTDVHFMQQRLLDSRLLPYRLELGILPLLGAISDPPRTLGRKARHRRHRHRAGTHRRLHHRQGGRAHAGAVRHGFSSIVQAARREFDLTHAAEVRERLHHADDELLLRASKFVRAIGRDLKPLVDSYEMTTGQPVGEIFCAYLPPSLSWIAEPLAHVIGRTPFTLDCSAWQTAVKITTTEGVNPLGQHWLGALSLIAELPSTAMEKAPKPDGRLPGPVARGLPHLDRPAERRPRPPPVRRQCRRLHPGCRRPHHHVLAVLSEQHAAHRHRLLVPAHQRQPAAGRGTQHPDQKAGRANRPHRPGLRPDDATLRRVRPHRQLWPDAPGQDDHRDDPRLPERRHPARLAAGAGGTSHPDAAHLRRPAPQGSGDRPQVRRHRAHQPGARRGQ
ncbi:MAG: hypothetical protein WDM96_09815 [Lacunisphaera sp.]